MNFLSNAGGSEGLAKMAGDKVGEVVEGTVKKVLGGGEKEKKAKEGGGAGGAGGGAGGAGAGGAGGGFDVGDLLSLGGGKKEEKGGGLDVKNVVGGFLK